MLAFLLKPDGRESRTTHFSVRFPDRELGESASPPPRQQHENRTPRRPSLTDRMKPLPLPILLSLSLFLAPGLFAQGNSANSNGNRERAPAIPVGTLSAFPTIVQTGTHPQLTWQITIPETVDDVIDIEEPGTVVPKRDLIMDIRILGAGAMPTQQSLEGEDLSLNFRVMPPVFQSGTTTYDPSDSPQDGDRKSVV